MDNYDRVKPQMHDRTELFSSSLNALLNNLESTGRGCKQKLSMAADSAVVIFSLWAAYSLRLGVPFSDLRSTWHIFLVVPLATIAIFSGLGIYRWIIRSTNQRLFKQLLKGSIISAMLILVLVFLLPPDRSNPRSLFVIYGLLVFLGTAGLRVGWRSLLDTGDQGEPIAVYGAGAGGQQLVSLLRNGNQYRPTVFIDDNESIAGASLYGLPVISGQSSDLRSALARYDVSKIVLAMPKMSSSDYHQKIQKLKSVEIPILTMPSIEELIRGTASADEIRDVSIGDILGRSEVVPDFDLMGRRVSGKTVLVTGGGGSIGSELCRQIIKLNPKRLIVVDNSEANLYHITEDINQNLATSPVASVSEFTPLLGSVLDRERMSRIFKKFAIDTVYHAAAYKHVPIVEAQPDVGVEVNVFGTLNTLELSIASGVLDFVLVSTDKAVRPTNAMGATKRVAELILQAKADQCVHTRISMVRFGNVLGSSGSVVPKFKRQILEGGPITLTHPDVTRYFMTIPEASQLVLQASAISEGGEVFVLDMGEPVRIEDLATTMVRLYGRKLQTETGNANDIDIVVEGLRPGEKLYEELFISDVNQCTEISKISCANELWLRWEDLSVSLEKLRRFSDAQNNSAIKSILLNLAFISDQHAEKAIASGCITLDDTGSSEKPPHLHVASDGLAVS